MNKKLVQIIICAFIIMLLGSCTTLKTRPEADTKTISLDYGVDVSDDFSKTFTSIKKVGILADICVAEHMHALLLNESISAEKEAIAGFKSYLKKNKKVPVLCPEPYVGSYITDQTGVDVKIGTVIENRTPPFVSPSLSDNDKEYNEALTKVIALAADMPNKSENRNSSFKPDENIIKSLSMIRDRTGSDALLVIIGQAQVYLRDKNNKIIGNETGVGFSNPSPDSIQIIDMRKDDIDSLALLVDFKSNQVIWSNSMRLNLPRDVKDYNPFFRNVFPVTMLKGISFM
ncbi:MAG TPA: hypothetical protein VIS94_10090 [Desulfomonilia bacterium]